MPGRRVTLMTVVALLTVATLDWFSQAEIAASLGYLLPVSLAAWGLGRLAAAITGGLAVGLWLVVDVVIGTGAIEPGLTVVNLVVLTVAFQLFGQLLANLREHLDQTHEMAHTDSLTKVHNRRAFWSATAREVERGGRDGDPFSVAYIDVDDFKGVNDRFGHRIGDELLCRIARALQQDLRQLDMVARLGGDEFAILMPGTGVFGADQVIARVRERLRDEGLQRAFGIDFSIGCLTVAEASADVDEIVAKADALMYDVKHAGRGQVRHAVLSPKHRGSVVAARRQRPPAAGDPSGEASRVAN
jgi:diguanylate cyclase (GGDEF)-like protein